MALVIDTTGVDVPVATLIGAVPVTFVTVPPRPAFEPTRTQVAPVSYQISPVSLET